MLLSTLLVGCLHEAAPVAAPDLIAGIWVSESTRLAMRPDGGGTLQWVPACLPWCGRGVEEVAVTLADGVLTRADGPSYPLWHTSRMLWFGEKQERSAWPASDAEDAAWTARVDARLAEQRAAAAPMRAVWAWAHGDGDGARAALSDATGELGRLGVHAAAEQGIDLPGLLADFTSEETGFVVFAGELVDPTHIVGVRAAGARRVMQPTRAPPVRAKGMLGQVLLSAGHNPALLATSVRSVGIKTEGHGTWLAPVEMLTPELVAAWSGGAPPQPAGVAGVWIGGGERLTLIPGAAAVRIGAHHSVWPSGPDLAPAEGAPTPPDVVRAGPWAEVEGGVRVGPLLGSLVDGTLTLEGIAFSRAAPADTSGGDDWVGRWLDAVGPPTGSRL